MTNLLTNAVKYNLEKGTLHLELNKDRLVVTNTGEAPAMPVSDLLQRFARGNSHTDGLGLGLSMVKEICDKNGFGFEITFEKGIWSAMVTFI